jgi:TonB-linked SusC/RagA family outer membrane protein
VSIDGKTVINIKLESRVVEGQQMIVTALGIKRESQSLGYSVDKVKPKEITTNQTTNFANALIGKLSGVHVSAPSSGPGGSSKIRIRGIASIGTNNAPLIVVNGVPINNGNLAVNSNAGKAGVNFSDAGNGLSSINPNNVESMTVLKSAAAAALYGARASNGVILITTKNGSSTKGVHVELNSNFQVKTPLDFRDYQFKYGQGEHGNYPNAPFPNSGVWSFGKSFKLGLTQTLFDNVKVPYKPQRNQLKEFYRKAYNLNNTVSISSGSKNGSFNFSLSDLKATSIRPKSGYNRYNLALGFTRQLADKLTVAGNVNYSKGLRINPPNVAAQRFSPVNIYTLANSMPMYLLKKFCCDDEGNEILWSKWKYRTNPYFTLRYRHQRNNRDRIFGKISATYNFTNWLSLRGRIGEDYFYRHAHWNVPTGAQYEASAPAGFVNGQFVQRQRRFREINADFLLTIKKDFGKYGLNVNLGGNSMIRRLDNKQITATDFYQRGIYTVGNSRTQTPSHDLLKKDINSLYGSAQISYKDMLYLTGTARDDWFSTLSPGNRSILYPSVSASFIFSNALRSAMPSWVNYGKLHLSYAQVGSDTDVEPYSNQLFYSINTNLYGTNPIGNISGSTLPNINLQPERIREYDIGIQMTLFSNYSFKVTYYYKKTSNQIINQQISNASGFSNRKINAATSRNEGFDASIDFDPVQNVNFDWNINANVNYNKSKLLSLGGDLKQITVGNAFFHGEVREVVGKELDQLFGRGWLRNSQGIREFDPVSGIPLFTDGLLDFGSGLPNWTGGITNILSYKNLSFSFLIDYELGNRLISGTDINAYREGLDKRTLRGRDQGYVVGEGVNPDGSINKTHAAIQSFYESIRAQRAVEQSLFNGGSWHLRQMSLGYNFTNLLPQNLGITGLSFSIVANNVFVLKKWTPNIDPDQNPEYSDHLSGLVSTGLPTTRGIGFNLDVKF